MAKWITIVTTFCPIEGTKLFYGDYIEAETQDEAQEWCNNNGKGYFTVTDQIFVEEVEEFID
jgi:hypothetical protein